MNSIAHLPSIARNLTGPVDIERLVDSMSDAEVRALLDDEQEWRLPYQVQPTGGWRTWIFQAGRGTGKTYTGSRWVTDIARTARPGHGDIALIGSSYGDLCRVMVEGSSGVLATAPHNFRPTWNKSAKELHFPNGVIARGYTADRPEGMRGGNWIAAWADEGAHWYKPQDIWDPIIEPALRKGRHPRALITTTPIPHPFLRELAKRKRTVVTRAATKDNIYLDPDVRALLYEMYGGTRIGRQELEGEILDDAPFALWRAEWIERNRVEKPPYLHSIVVGVDPSVTYTESSDECGIIVAGEGLHDDRGYVLADYSIKAAPHEWAAEAVRAYHRHDADAIVIEVNQGGDLCKQAIHAVDRDVPVRTVFASRGKRARAEPVAAMYEQDRVSHCGVFSELEREQTEWQSDRSKESPNRMDALVWALSHCMLAKRRGILEGI